MLEAAEHDAEAIERRADWVMLNYVSAAERHNAGVPRGWYGGDPRCAKDESDPRACDEYPYYASAQGGPGASLKLIDAEHNAQEGRLYEGFLSSCMVTSGDPFLVLPMPSGNAPPTRRICVH